MNSLRSQPVTQDFEEMLVANVNELQVIFNFIDFLDKVNMLTRREAVALKYLYDSKISQRQKEILERIG